VTETLFTGKQVRDRSVAAMPSPLGEEYYALYNEVSWLHARWADFWSLYANDQETIDLLNTVAPAFFNELQRMMWEDVLLHLCRLTDPPSSFGHDNLTVRRLSELVSDTNLKKQLQLLIDDADHKTRFARDWRNRRLAHKDLPLAVGNAAKPLEAANRQHVDQAFDAIRQIMNCIEQEYLDGPVLYEHMIEQLGGVQSLLTRLRKGAEAERIEREKFL